MYDIAIIGGGPAGFSAALNCKILGKNFLWLAAENFSSKAAKAEKISNYPGLPAISGGELCAAFLKHERDMGLEPQIARVTGVYPMDGYFSLLAEGESFTAKSLVLCLGANTAKPKEGEEEFLGRGISYCATCDGMLYRGKKIAVVCSDKSLEHEVEFLCKAASQCYLFPLYKNCQISAPNAEIILKTPTGYFGHERVERVQMGEESLEVDGVFILNAATSPTALLKGLKTENGHIITDKNCATNISGVFAAGDCTGRPYQYAKAVGEGNIAAHAAVEYLNGRKI